MAPFALTNMQFIVQANAGSSVLMFGARNDPQAFGLDDVSVVPISLPSFKAVAMANHACTLTWTAVPGLVYQVQYTTNLAANVWNNLGSAISATNATLSLLDVQLSDAQRFYRVWLSP
jgi:hypothetical protein